MEHSKHNGVLITSTPQARASLTTELISQSNAANKWRKLALSFDAARMSANSLLSNLLTMHDEDVFTREPWDKTFEMVRALLNAAPQSVMQAERTRLSAITDVEADAVRNAMDALRADPQAGPVGLGSICVLEDLLARTGYDEEGVTTYDYYAKLMQENGQPAVPRDAFPLCLRPLGPVEPDPDHPYTMVSRVKSGRVYYSVEYDCLCQIVANYWDDGACYIGERYTDDITGSYFITEQDRLREVLP